MKNRRVAQNRVIRLRRGQTIRLVCGIGIVSRRITLRPGEFVVVTCAGSARVVTVGCQEFNRRIRIHLARGQQLFVHCDC